MSTKYYDQIWAEALQEFIDLYKLELSPFDQVAADPKKKFAVKKPTEWLQFYANLYVQYIQTYKKLELAYDQVIHPQKRLIYKNILDNTMMRLVEIRKDLVMFNVGTKALNSDFVNFDEMLFELKILPEKLEIPIPNYYKEGEEKQIRRDAELLDELAKVDRHLPEEEVMVVRNPVEMEPGTEMWMILVNERGRQGIIRGQEKRALLQAALKKKKKIDLEKNKDVEGYTIIQKYLRAYIDRQRVEELRNDEMEFLGMLPSKPQYDDLNFVKDPKNFDIDKEIEKIKSRRKGYKQVNMARKLETMIDDVKNEIIRHETPDMKENLLYEMRNWITEYYEQHEGKELPEKVEDFYNRNDKAPPRTKEEEDAKKKEDAEKAKAAKKAADDKKKKKKTEGEAFMDERAALGPDNSRALRALNENVQHYKEEWGADTGDNFEQLPSKEKIIREVMPEIEEDVSGYLKID